MTEGNTDPSEIQQRLTVKEAADALGISSDAVRTRIQRGTLRSIHERGRVWVVLDPDETRSNTIEHR
jgi:excisionase family DNA binding protein